MGNPNKAKGDRAEAAVTGLIQDWFPESWRTRAGWDQDRGDVILDLLGDKSILSAIQVKDTADRPGGPVMAALVDQVRQGGSRWGFIWWKLRGKGHPEDWQVLMSGRQFMELMAHIRDLHTALDGVGADGRPL